MEYSLRVRGFVSQFSNLINICEGLEYWLWDWNIYCSLKKSFVWIILFQLNIFYSDIYVNGKMLFFNQIKSFNDRIMLENLVKKNSSKMSFLLHLVQRLWNDLDNFFPQKIFHFESLIFFLYKNSKWRRHTGTKH